MKALDAVDAMKRFYNSWVRLMNCPRLRKSGGGAAPLAFPKLGPGLLFSTGYPLSPLFPCKILKTNKLFYDYLLDL